jgi:hypothetical protein
MSDVEFETNDNLIRIGGRELRDVDPIISDEMFDRACKGYLCISCWEPQEVAFPVKCRASWCGYPMKNRQAEDIQRLYSGVATPPPERFYDQNELDERARDEYEEKGIWLPPR